MIHVLEIADAAVKSIAPEWWSPLVSGGSAATVLGAIVIWFAVRLEKLLERLREAVERNSNALMIAVLTVRHLDDAVKPLAEKIKDDSASSIRRT